MGESAEVVSDWLWADLNITLCTLMYVNLYSVWASPGGNTKLSTAGSGDYNFHNDTRL